MQHFFIRLGVLSLLFMIPLHFLLLHFKIFYLGLLPAAFFLGLAFISFGLAFIAQFVGSKKRTICDPAFGLFLALAGLCAVSIDYIFSFPTPAWLFTFTGISLFISIVGILVFGLAYKWTTGTLPKQ